MSAELVIYVPGRRIALVGDLTQENAPQVAAALEEWLPAIARERGRAGVVILRDGVEHLVARAGRDGCLRT